MLMGLAFGSYNLTYERLAPGGHGFLVEGMLSRSKKSDASQTNGGMSIGYRWHWSGGQDSDFWGANIGYGHGVANGSITTTSTDGMDTKNPSMLTPVFCQQPPTLAGGSPLTTA
jgi:hypothetical protein